MTVSNLLAQVSNRSTGFFGDDFKFVAPKFGNEVFDKHDGIFAHRKSIVKSNLSGARIPLCSAVRLNSGMSRFECRKQWLRSLQEKEGSLNALAERIGTDPSYVSSILGQKAKRQVGDDLARRIEKTYSLPIGALDLPSIGACKLIRAAEGLDDGQLEEVVAFIEFRKASKH